MNPLQRIIGGRYQLIRLIAEGGMGAVYEARHLVTGRIVALKLVHASVRRIEGVAERFLREAKAPAAIGHPGIVEILDAGVDGDDLFLAMEMLAGETLRTRLSREGVSPTQKLELIRALLEPLAAAHAKGFVHRDLKPENAFVAHSALGGETIKLLDFGITRQLNAQDGVTRTGASLGTPTYMSPEQCMDAREATPASDVWSVGVMLYEVLTGCAPFRGDSVNAVVVRICTEEIDPIRRIQPTVSVELAAIVEACLSKDPGQRPSVVQLLTALGGPAGPRFVTPGRVPHRAVISLATVLAVTGVVALGLFVSREQPPSNAANVAPQADADKSRGLAVGFRHACAIVAGDHVACWGDNTFGQLGDGTTSLRDAAVFVEGIENPVSVAAGDKHSCAVTADGRAWCWGDDEYGQLGDRGGNGSPAPASIGGLPPAIRIFANGIESCALTRSGQVYCWGGCLPIAPSVTPFLDRTQTGCAVFSGGTARGVTRIGGAEQIVSVLMSARSSCGVTQTNSVLCWDSRESSGNALDARISATPVSGVLDAAELFANGNGICSRSASGIVMCWGESVVALSGEATNASTPRIVGRLPSVRSVAGGDPLVCYAQDDGEVICWGRRGSWTDRDQGTQPALTGAVELAASGARFCARLANDTIRCIGDSYSPKPLPIESIRDLSALSAGPRNICGLAGDTLWCWGEALGPGPINDGRMPVIPPTAVATGVTSIASPLASELTCLQRESVLSCVGFRKLDDRSPHGNVTAEVPITGVRSLSGASALGEDGKVRAWRSFVDERGQVVMEDRLSAQPKGLPSLKQLSAARDYSCGVSMSAKVVCWGSNYSGQLGSGDAAATGPTYVRLPGTPRKVSASDTGLVCALFEDGRVTCWGWIVGERYHLGGDPTPRTAVLPIANDVSAGSNHACAVTYDGSVFCWGNNSQGQLGNGSFEQAEQPVRVIGIQDAVSVVSGEDFSCCLRRSGAVSCWGDNNHGQLAIGASQDVRLPARK